MVHLIIELVALLGADYTGEDFLRNSFMVIIFSIATSRKAQSLVLLIKPKMTNLLQALKQKTIHKTNVCKVINARPHRFILDRALAVDVKHVLHLQLQMHLKLHVNI